MTDTKDMRRSCLTIGDINWAQAHIDAQDAKIKALVEAVENERENVCQDFGIQLKLSEVVDAALAAVKETI